MLAGRLVFQAFQTNRALSEIQPKKELNMKFNLKMIAAAAALASMAGAANADIVTQGQSGSLVLTALNTVTNSFYMRDLGFTLSTFLPTGAANSVGFTGSAIVGDKTPTAGLTLNAANTANFGDAAFSTWYGAQTSADVKWFVNAVDSISSASTGVSRLITSSINTAQTASNGQVTNFVSSANAGGLDAFFNPATPNAALLSVTGTTTNAEWANNFGLGGNGLAAVGESASLFYFTRSVATGSTSVSANGGPYGNGTNFASVLLASNGDFSYTLAAPVSAVPLPAAAWLMGAGLVALGGAARRRKAAAQA